MLYQFRENCMDEENKIILLVEDEPVISLIESAILKKGGYNVKTVPSGEKAIDLISGGGNFDLILMDIDLGKSMDGTEAAERILQIKEIPVLFLSSHTEPEIVKKTEGITSYGYVVKNSGDTVLLASIKMAFRLYYEKLQVREHKDRLQSLNEELEAANEELNAAMEELEASNEELISSQHEIAVTEERYRRLFTSSNDGVCVHELIYRDGKASDYMILDANDVFESATGLRKSDVAGKLASEIYGTGNPPYLDVYASVAETEVPVAFDTYFEPMDKHFHISVFSPGKGMFATVFQDITERVRSERFLRESEEKYRLLFENMVHGVFYQLDDGTLVDINPAGLEMFGITREQFLGRTSYHPEWKVVDEDFNLLKPEDHPSMKALRMAQKIDVIVGVFNPDERIYRWLSVSAIPQFREGDGKPYQAVVTMHDITDIKLAENALRESETRYRELFDNISSGVAIYRAVDTGNDFIFMDFNKAGERMDGDSRESLIGRSVMEAYPGIKEFGLFDVFQRVWRSGVPEHFPVALYRDEKHERWYDNYVYRLPSGEIVAIYNDYTEKKLAEDALRESEEKFRNIFRNAPIGLLHYDIKGFITECNDIFTGVIGSTQEKLVGLNMHDLNDNWLIEELDRSLNGSTGYYEGDYHSVTADKITPVRVWFTPIFSPERKVTGGICITEDISVQKKALAEIKESEERFRTLFETLSQGVVYHDLKGEIIDANPAAEVILGLSRDHLLGRTSYHPQWKTLKEDFSDFPAEEHPVMISLRTGKPVRGVIMGVFNPLEKHHRWLSVDAMPEFMESSGKLFRAYTTFTDITLRRQAEIVLRDSEERYRSLAEVSPNAIIVHQYRRIVYINDTGVKLLGALSRDELIGTEFLNRVHADSVELVNERIGLVLERNSRVPAIELQMIRMSGEMFYAESMAGPIMHNGAPAVQVILRDISDRKRYDIAVIEQKQLLDTVINSIPAPVFFKDSDGRYLGCNNAFVEFIGHEREEIVGRKVFELYPDELSGTYHEMDMSVMESGGTQVYETDVMHSDGTMRRVILHKAVFQAADGSVKGLVGVMMDITDRKKNENVLRQMKEDLEMAQSAAHMGNWKWHVKEDRVEWSDEIYKIFGLDKTLFSGKLSEIMFSSIHPDDREKVEASNMLVIDENKPNAAEFRVVRSDGTERIVWSESVELKVDESDRPEILRGYMQDITERKKTEEKLEMIVKEKEALLREIQHRVKNNLVMISGLISLESFRAQGNEAVRLLSSLRSRIGALEQLYTSLIQSGDIKVVRIDRYITEIVQSIMNTYVSGIHNIQVETELEPLEIPFRNAGSIGLIINELVINALKYAFPDGMDGKIVIGLKSGRSGYEVYVRDNGAGLSPGFDVENPAGSGIMIIKMMVEHMGGALSVASDTSTEFRISIPFDE